MRACRGNYVAGTTDKLSEGVEKLLESYERINIHWVFDPKTMDLEKYYKQLVKISDMLLNYYNKGHIKLINLLTDDLFNREKTNCEFGNKNYVLAPDGKVYICPIMFYEKNGIYTKELNEFQHKSIKQFSLEANPICKDCNIKHCKWCFSYSKVSTGEYNVPSSIQCKIAQVEKQATNYLYQNLKKNGLEEYCGNYIENVTFEDPLFQKKEKILPLLNFSFKVK